ncbi:1783_t:CDS:2, partial [Entrophospora sp. SA101]
DLLGLSGLAEEPCTNQGIESVINDFYSVAVKLSLSPCNNQFVPWRPMPCDLKNALHLSQKVPEASTSTLLQIEMADSVPQDTLISFEIQVKLNFYHQEALLNKKSTSCYYEYFNAHYRTI